MWPYSLSLSDLNHQETCQWSCEENDCEPKLVPSASRIDLSAKQSNYALLQQCLQEVSPRQSPKSPMNRIGSIGLHSHLPADVSSGSKDMIEPISKQMQEKCKNKADSFQLPENSNGKRDHDWQKEVLSNLEKKLKTLNLVATSSGVPTKSPIAMQDSSKFECQFPDCGQLFPSSVACFSHQRSHILSQMVQKPDQISANGSSVRT